MHNLQKLDIHRNTYTGHHCSVKGANKGTANFTNLLIEIYAHIKQTLTKYTVMFKK